METQFGWTGDLAQNRAIDHRCVWIVSGKVLAEHSAPAVIDFALIDTEGSEFDILKAVDFDRWSFRVMTVEHNFTTQRDDIYGLLTSKGYVRVLEDF